MSTGDDALALVSAIPLEVDYGGETYSDALPLGRSWRVGRMPLPKGGLGVQLVLAQVSSISFLIDFPDLQRPIFVRTFQRGAAQVRVESDAGDSLRVTAGAILPLRHGAAYEICLDAPGRILSIRFTTPSQEHALRESPGYGPGDTLTLSGVPKDSWIWVAALAVMVDVYPEMCPVGSGGKRWTRSATHLEAVHLHCGHSNSYWRNSRLKEALVQAQLKVLPGQPIFDRVALHYRDYFSSSLIEQLRAELEDALKVVAATGVDAGPEWPLSRREDREEREAGRDSNPSKQFETDR